MKTAVPGLIAVAAGVAFGLGVASAAPALSALVVAMVAGVLAANLGLLGSWAEPGIQIARSHLLKVGVVLLGFRLSLLDVLELGGPPGLLFILAISAVTFVGTRALSRRLRLSSPLGLLLATGYSICGASAIAAMAPLAEADEDETAAAVGLVTLFGTAAVFTLPAIGDLLGLTATQAGYWAGASVHDVAQVVATASANGEEALNAGVVVKLSRVVLLAPLLAAVSFQRSRSAKSTISTAGAEVDRPPILPVFVLLFLVAVAIRSSNILSQDVLSVLGDAEKLFLAAAMFGLGATVRISSLRHLGHRPLTVGALAWLLIAAISLPVAVLIAP